MKIKKIIIDKTGSIIKKTTKLYWRWLHPMGSKEEESLIKLQDWKKSRVKMRLNIKDQKTNKKRIKKET